ncbi:MAG: histidine phosphatase family protein [Proteobacteria bacterium]|nr:histidine phosphatase family protein [Pseudomonadota bacterium]
MNLYFFRHGESEANVQGIFSNRGFIHGLTPLGGKQVSEGAEKLKNIKFDCMISSPLKRAVQSSEILSESLNLSFTVDNRLNEIDLGELEGKSDEKSRSRFLLLLDDWVINKNYTACLAGGESLIDAKNRLFHLIRDLEIKHSKQSNILMVGHATTFCYVLPFFLKNISLDFAAKNLLGNGLYIFVDLNEKEYHCKVWGNIPF